MGTLCRSRAQRANAASRATTAAGRVIRGTTSVSVKDRGSTPTTAALPLTRTPGTATHSRDSLMRRYSCRASAAVRARGTGGRTRRVGRVRIARVPAWRVLRSVGPSGRPGVSPARLDDVARSWTSRGTSNSGMPWTARADSRQSSAAESHSPAAATSARCLVHGGAVSHAAASTKIPLLRRSSSPRAAAALSHVCERCGSPGSRRRRSMR